MMRDDGEDLDAAERREEREVAAARAAVVESLGALRARLAHEPDVAVRRALPYLFAVCDDQAARPILCDHLRSETDAAARASVVLALGALGQRELPDGAEPAVLLAAAIAGADAARIQSALDGLATLDALDVWTDGEAVRFVLHALPSDERLPVIAAMTEHEDPGTRHAAVDAATDLAATWRLPTAGVVDLLVACLRDDTPGVRDAAARGLHELCPASASAADALLAAGSPTALRALARLRDPRVLPLLSAALAEDDPAPWTADALESLGTLAAEVSDRVIALLPALTAPSGNGPDNRLPKFTLWLGQLHQDGAVPAIVDVLRSGSTDRAAVRALGTLGPLAADARPAIDRFLSDPDDFIRAQAAVAVARIAGDRGPLLQTIEELLATPQRGALGEALDALDDFDPERLEPLLDHDDEWVRLPAARAIWRITRDHHPVAQALRTLAAPTPSGEQALAALAEMPPEAFAPLREQLLQWRDADRRPVEWGSAAEVVERDERLRELATPMLRAL